jgi:hypothetical protein
MSSLAGRSTAPHAEDMLLEARQRAGAATTRDELLSALSAYELAYHAMPDSPDVLVGLSSLNLLMGAAYCETVGTKRTRFLNCIRYSERAMGLNAVFRKRVMAGATVAEACKSLGRDDLPAMHFWSTGCFYLFRDGLGLIRRMSNFQLFTDARAVLDRMEALDPEWGDGQVLFSLGVCSLAPERFGGGRAKSKDYFDRAVATGPSRLLHRWGRAKYFQLNFHEDEDEFRKDLEWVVRQPLSEDPILRAWQRFFREDAEEMLRNIDGYFPSGS